MVRHIFVWKIVIGPVFVTWILPPGLHMAPLRDPCHEVWQRFLAFIGDR